MVSPGETVGRYGETVGLPWSGSGVAWGYLPWLTSGLWETKGELRFLSGYLGRLGGFLGRLEGYWWIFGETKGIPGETLELGR